MKKPLLHAEQVEVKSRNDLHLWLERNHGRDSGVWLISYRKHSEHHIPYEEIVEECLCFGWVDSLPRALDAARSMRYIVPRKPKSGWSRINKQKADELMRSGQMTLAGRRKIEEAIKDGSWDKLNEVEAGVIDNDLALALDSLNHARANFDAFPPSSRRLILEWIVQAKRPETRAKRIRDTAEKASKNIRANHARQ